MPTLKIDHRNTKCCKCGNDKTRIKWLDLEGKEVPDWRRHRCNRKDCTNYVCYDCYIVGPKKSREYFLEKTMRRKCCKCGTNETYIRSSGYPMWFNCHCNAPKCTRFICHKCYKNYLYYEKGGREDAKSTSLIRNGLLEEYKNIGPVGEAVIAKIRKLEILSIKMDNFNYKFDLSYDIEYGMIQVKTKLPYYGSYKIDIGMEHNFDNIFILCISKDEKNIEKIYIIPEGEFYGMIGFTIVENLKPSISSKWEKFRVDEKTKDIYNGAYQNLKLFLGDKKYFGIEDIKKWMKLQL